MIQEFLKTIPLFKGLDDDDLAQVLMVSLIKRYRREAVILAEGAPGGRLYVIHQGQVRLSKIVPGFGEEALVILSPGDLFGEAEFFDGAPAAMHAIAHSDAEVMSLPHREISGMMQSRPELAAKFLWAFGHALSTRLKETNHKLGSLLAMSRVY
ncbi:MAG: cyclic nucleotide-binding domain-containing protein [Vicinamibacteria bacterium]|jgi:CRP-like cAMP-binding protein|nr:cyclic nucleotide-binding domain-containing protein [Vicinamibacteria bacterium]